MGCAPSRSVHPATRHSQLSWDHLRSREEYEQHARHMLSRLRLIPPVQRRRAPLSEENGTYWIYWRPGREENDRRRREEVELYPGGLFPDERNMENNSNQ